MGLCKDVIKICQVSPPTSHNYESMQAHIEQQADFSLPLSSSQFHWEDTKYSHLLLILMCSQQQNYFKKYAQLYN